MRRVIILINIFILMSLVACNGINDKNQDIIVDQAWARPAYQGNPSAVYFKIQNYLDEADRTRFCRKSCCGSQRNSP